MVPEINRRCCVQCDNGGAGSLNEPRPELVALQQPNGTIGRIEADDLRALARYVEQRDAH